MLWFFKYFRHKIWLQNSRFVHIGFKENHHFSPKIGENLQK
jgi:hypothetical protein